MTQLQTPELHHMTQLQTPELHHISTQLAVIICIPVVQTAHDSHMTQLHTLSNTTWHSYRPLSDTTGHSY